jgi:hypothetical protein
MLALAFSTGFIVDAAGHLGPDRVFPGHDRQRRRPRWRRPAVTTLPIAGPALALAGFTRGVNL